MSFLLLGILNAQVGGASSPYFLSIFRPPSSYSQFDGIAVNSSGDVYLSGGIVINDIMDAVLIKIDSLGAVQWQRFFRGTGSDIGDEVAVDSEDNIYINVYSFSGDARAVLAKFNPSGTLQWKVGMATKYGVTRGVSATGTRIYLSLEPGISQEQNNFAYAEFNSSGILQREREVFGSLLEACYYIHSDDNNNVYIGGESRTGFGGSIRVGYITKYDTSGIVQWQRFFGGTATFGGCESVATDSLGNIYALMKHNGANVVKYNASGILQWQRKFAGVSAEGVIEVDASDNVYFIGTRIFKLDTSGNVQFQRNMSSNLRQTIFKSLTFDSAGDLYLGGTSSELVGGFQKIVSFVSYLPQDGSLTGDYVLGDVTYTYEASNTTVSTSNEPHGTGSLSTRNPTYGTISTVLQSSTSNLTQLLTNL